MQNNKLSDYLKPTFFCDSDNVEIIDFAKNLTKNVTDSREKAIILFNEIRDNILYRFDYWNLKASQTLKKKSGMCTNKNNLLIACLRSIGIPAGYGIMKVKAREYFGPLILPTFKKMVSTRSVHIYSLVEFENQWIKIDASVDRQLSDKTNYICYSTKLAEWDGFNDAIENLDPNHILEDTYPLVNIDIKLQKKPEMLTSSKLQLSNLYVEFLRTTSNRFKNVQELEESFMKWLRKESTFFYIYYILQRKF